MPVHLPQTFDLSTSTVFYTFNGPDPGPIALNLFHKVLYIADDDKPKKTGKGGGSPGASRPGIMRYEVSQHSSRCDNL